MWQCDKSEVVKNQPKVTVQYKFHVCYKFLQFLIKVMQRPQYTKVALHQVEISSNIGPWTRSS